MLKVKIGYPDKRDEDARWSTPCSTIAAARCSRCSSQRHSCGDEADRRIDLHGRQGEGLRPGRRGGDPPSRAVTDSTNSSRLIEYGASPRASINLCLAARANAFLVGRGYVTPQDVKDMAPDILRHRVILTYEAEAEETTSDDVVRTVLESVPVP